MRKWPNCKIKRWEREDSESLKRIFSCFLAWIPYLVRAFPQVGSMCTSRIGVTRTERGNTSPSCDAEGPDLIVCRPPRILLPYPRLARGP